MVTTRKRKVGKYRGHTTHGGGHRKKRRGAGSRGGRGRAGTGKRAGHKKAGISEQLGKRGFTSKRGLKKEKSINLSYFTLGRVKILVETGKAKNEGNLVVINLKKMGYDRLLGAGEIMGKYSFRVLHCSKSAAEKVKAKGGEIISISSGNKNKPTPGSPKVLDDQTLVKK